MINSSVIISGEASETDSDDDICSKSNKMFTSIQGAIITGEDSESDDENEGSISSATSALAQQPKEPISSATPERNKNESLLHKKLRECNYQLYTDVESFCQNVVNQAGKNLSAIDQQLLKSQNTLQTAVTSLRSLNLNSSTLKDRLQSILSSKFIPNIKTKSEDT